jgi:hypothetical protein
MRPGRLLRVVVFMVLVGGSLAVAQMPAMPQMPQPSPTPPMSPANPNQIPQDPQQMPSMGQSGQSGQSSQSEGGGQGAGFLGAWCAQGDPTKQTSISNNGAFLNLTNESGDTSIGNLQGSNEISAPGWQFVTGTLSGDGSRINWSNGTFWARCYNGGGGGGNRRPNLNGNWYPNGNRAMSCSIQQRRGNLTLQNESGQRATGSFNGRSHLSTNWQGTMIGGTLSRDGNRINWDNGTYWIRYRLY